jgi:hypothetical protein
MTEAPRPIETQALGAHVPERMRHAITRALAKNKDERYATVKEFYEAFSGTGLPNQTAVMNQAANQASAASHPGADPNGGAAAGGGRAKTEMGAPVMGGGPPAGAMTPPYGGAGMGPGMGTAGPSGPGAVPAVVPAGPTHHSAKKGGNGLIIGLAALAVLLIGGGVLALVLRGGKPKVVVTDPLDLNGSAVVSDASVAPIESAAAGTTDTDAAVAPLGGVVTTAVAVKTATGTGGAKPVPVFTATAVVTTPTIKAEPPICANARAARAANRPTAALLEAKCRAAGGTP